MPRYRALAGTHTHRERAGAIIWVTGGADERVKVTVKTGSAWNLSAVSRLEKRRRGHKAPLFQSILNR
jgi:hypothetical protein